MREYQVAKDIRLRIDAHGNVTLMQMDTLVNPEIATSAVHLSALGAVGLVATLVDALHIHSVEERRRSA